VPENVPSPDTPNVVNNVPDEASTPLAANVIETAVRAVVAAVLKVNVVEVKTVTTYIPGTTPVRA
jgi:hypothetical protein